MQKTRKEHRQPFKVPFKTLTLGPVSDQCEPYVGQALQPPPQCLKILFRRDPPNIKDERTLGMSLCQALAHFIRSAGRAKQVGIHTARPQSYLLDSMLLKLADHQCGRTEIDRRPPVANPKNLPDVRLENAEAVVVKIFGKVGMVGNHNRQMKRPALPAAAIIEPGYPQQCRIGDVKNIWLELCVYLPYGSARKCQTKFRV